MALRRFEVAPADGGKRADALIAQQLGLSRAKVKELFDSGAIRVDGRRAKKGQPVQAGQRVEAEVLEVSPLPVAEPDAKLPLLQVDDALVFIDKPAGMPSHPLKPGEKGTVANALLGQFPECAEASEDPREGGLCHRLDTETSGVILAARSRAAWIKVREQFSKHTVEKHYWAAVTGPIADEGEIDVPLRHPRRSDRVVPAVDAPDAREALTKFRVAQRSGEYALVDAQIITGVMHQVRAHLSAIGAPIVGDSLYGGRSSSSLGRFFLHASSLALTHPLTGAHLRVESPMPEDLRRWLGEHLPSPAGGRGSG